jgi:hypothetical protein
VKKFSDFLEGRCWPGFKPVPGKKPYSPGSCVKESAAAAIAAATAIAKKKSGNYDEKGFRKTPYKNPDHPNRKSNTEREAELKEDLRKWFSKTDPAGGWKRINSKGEAIGPCAREPGEPKPKCMSNEKRASLTKKERASAVASKRRNDPNPERQGKPINVSNFGKGKISEDMENLDEKNVPTSPEKWAQAKSQAKAKFDVYPSAYANGWASKKYKEMGGGWKSVSEDTEVTEGAVPAQEKIITVKHKTSGKTLRISAAAAAKYRMQGYHYHPVNEAKDEQEYGYEGDMALNQLATLTRCADMIKELLKPDTDMPEWVQSKITLATDYIQTAADYMYSEMKESVEQIGESEKHPFVAVHAKKGKHETHGSTSYEAAQNAAKHWKMKNTAGIDVYRSDKKHVAEEVVQEGRPSQRHPLEGHEYHKKTNAELEYIAKDAHKAAEAMKSHNTTAENKYRDQANDSATVRHFRKTSGSPDWYKKKYGLKEEVEQIDELSNATLRGYADKARTDIQKTLPKLHTDAKAAGRIDKRVSGLAASSIAKVKNNMKKEEVEHLNEDDGLKSIAKKHGMEYHPGTYGANMSHAKKGFVNINRYGEWSHHKEGRFDRGHGPATAHGDSSQNFKDLDKHLSSLKEEIEQIHEISDKLAGDYLKKVNDNLIKKVGFKPDLYNHLEPKRQKGATRALNRLMKPVEEGTSADSDGGPPTPAASTLTVTGQPKLTKTVGETKLVPFVHEGAMKRMATDKAEDKHLGSWKVETPWTKIKGTGTVTDKSGAKHTPMSRARDLARQAFKRKVEEQSNVQPNPFTIPAIDIGKAPKKPKEASPVAPTAMAESRQLEIVREAMRVSKKKKEEKVTEAGSDKFIADPELTSQITKSNP